MTSLPFASVLDKGMLLVSSEISDTMMMGLGSLLTWFVPFDSPSEYTSSTLAERGLSTTLAQLGSLEKDWRSPSGGFLFFNSACPFLILNFFGVN